MLDLDFLSKGSVCSGRSRVLIRIRITNVMINRTLYENGTGAKFVVAQLI